MLFYGFYGPYPILLIVSLILSMFASSKVNAAYNRYSRIYDKSGFTGAQAARKILDYNGLYDVQIEMISGKMTDHYDPSKRIMRLSEGVYNQRTIAAVSIAAHESGHAVQHGENYFFLKMRNAIAVPVNFASKLSWVCIILGIVLSGTSQYVTGGWLLDAGIILFSLVVLFSLITLPVELNASKRAVAQLETLGIIYPEEKSGAKSMLSAAALTYLASLVAAIVQLLRLLAIRGRN